MLRPMLCWRLFFVLSMSLVAVCGLTACGMTTPNTTETTAPTLTWMVQEDNNSPATYIGNATISANPGTSFIITLIAGDPGGVQHITLNSTNQLTCANGNTVQSYGPEQDMPTATLHSHPNRNNQVPTSLEWPHHFSLPDSSDCSAGYTPTAACESLVGTGTNYANRTVQATFRVYFGSTSGCG